MGEKAEKIIKESDKKQMNNKNTPTIEHNSEQYFFVY